MNSAQELIDLLDLEQLEENIFRGQNFMAPWKRVFGGQVLAQSLHAAYQTLPADRIAHSMHAYFILGGDIQLPIVYQVDRVRDGGSFSTRRVVAIQKGRVIFNMSASFQAVQEGFEHQIAMPNVPTPDMLLSDEQLAESFKTSAPELYKRYKYPRPIEFRPVEKFNPAHPQKSQPFRHVWIKLKGKAEASLALHQQMLAYASDYFLVETAILPHQDATSVDKLFFASLDHAMWFHREFRMDHWLLYAIDSPSASNSRGFARGNIFTEDGMLVASVVQEGLIRPLATMTSG